MFLIITSVIITRIGGMNETRPNMIQDNQGLHLHYNHVVKTVKKMNKYN